MKGIPPRTSTGRLRSADPQRFRTRPRQQERGEFSGLPPVRGERFEKPERRKPLGCLACGGTNINGAEERGGTWHVWCIACDSMQPAKERP